MPGLIGKKIGMTSLFDENGKNLPCTVIEVSPNVVTQIKTPENDGYTAVQVGYGTKSAKNTPAALQGHFRKAGVDPQQKLAEFDLPSQMEELKLGQELRNVDLFAEGEFVDVAGISKGKGFQGVVKRHGFSGSERTHGQQSMLRAPGSVGAGSDPSRIFKGMKMAGRTGGKRTSVENLRVIKVDAEKNILVLKGSVPGPKNSLVIISK